MNGKKKNSAAAGAAVYTRPSKNKLFGPDAPGKSKMYKEYRIEGLDCANCAAEVEKEINKMDEVAAATLNFAAARLSVEFREGIDMNRAYLKMIRVIAGIESGVILSDTSEAREQKQVKQKILMTPGNIVKLCGVLVFIAAVLLQFVGAEAHGHGEVSFVWNLWAEADSVREAISILLYYAAFLMCGHSVLKTFFLRLMKGRLMDENFLMTIVGIGAIILGENLEAVAILIFYQVGELCQSLAVERSRNSIKALVSMSTKAVNKLVEGGQVAEVPPETVKVGDKIIVRTGEKVALDGVVHTGVSALDTSALTGESMPVNIAEGDDVFSGSVNIQNVFTESVKKQYSESTVAKILGMVESATEKKARSEQFITKFSKIYTPCVVILAVIIAIFIPLIFPPHNFSQWIYTGLMFLIVSCPCALVLSIPMSFFGGVGAASKKGILLKGSNYLESLAALDTVVFDKTGTLTRGVFEVTALEPAKGVTAAELIKKAAYAESLSTHPIARSIVREYPEKIDTGLVSGYAEYGGHGISAVLSDKKILCGNAALMEKEGAACAAAKAPGTAVYIAEDGRYLGAIVLNDTIKPDAADALADLKGLGVKKTVMLTGDKDEVAMRVGKDLGLDEVHSQLMPEDKLAILDGIIAGKENGGGKKRGGTAFVGEGINDVPSITRADVGIAMGALGSDAAMEVANVVLMTDEVAKLPMSIRIARKTRQIVFINIIFTLITKVLIMALSLFLQAAGLMFPNFILIAEFADVGVALIAILIASTILRYNPVPKAARAKSVKAHAHTH